MSKGAARTSGVLRAETCSREFGVSRRLARRWQSREFVMGSRAMTSGRGVERSGWTLGGGGSGEHAAGRKQRAIVGKGGA